MLSKFKNNSILIVEDDYISRLTMESQLKEEGFGKLYTASNEKEVNEVIKNKDIDLLIMDIRLENDDYGIDIVNNLKSRKDYPVIYVTASTDKKTLKEALDTNPVNILNKPVDYNVLFSTIACALNRLGLDIIQSKSENKDILSLIYETASIGMCLTDHKGNFVKVNEAYCKTYGYSRDFLISRNFTTVLPTEQKAYGQEMHDKFINEEIVELPGNWQVMTSDGEIKDVFVTAGRFTNDNGEIFKVTTVTDETKKKENERVLEDTIKERDILIREVHHRVKNNLNLISNLFQLQLMKLSVESEAHNVLKSGMTRMKSLAILHELLYHRGDLQKINLNIYLNQLCKSLMSTFSSGKSKRLESRVSIDDHEISIDRAVSIGIILNELVTNSIKHSNPAKNTLHISVNFSSSNENNKKELKVSDDGDPMSKDFDLNSMNTLGFQLISTLVNQVKGEFSYRESDGFKHFIIEF